MMFSGRLLRYSHSVARNEPNYVEKSRGAKEKYSIIALVRRLDSVHSENQ